MLAFHINSAAPFIAKTGGENDFTIELFDIYNTILSALTWRRFNGTIKLITDKTVYGYYKNLGILDIWDKIDTSLSENIEGINPLMFWAAGKLLALRDEKAPVVMLDTDFIIWEKLSFSGKELVTAHREDLNPDIYPPPSVFRLKKGYAINKNYNLSVLPCNTAFLYIKDESFKQYYTNMAIEFMKSVENSDDNLCHMVFAEQRLLGMCADYLKIPVTTLLDKEKLGVPQSSFTHLWGAKRVLKNDIALREDFCRRCRERINNDFPKFSYLLDRLDKNHRRTK